MIEMWVVVRPIGRVRLVVKEACGIPKRGRRAQLLHRGTISTPLMPASRLFVYLCVRLRVLRVASEHEPKVRAHTISFSPCVVNHANDPPKLAVKGMTD
jgi:hypothetical protein